MDGIVCAACHAWLPSEAKTCPGCASEIVLAGETKNVIDSLQPNCLIHRYEGSDLLEPAAVVKVGKANVKVATRLREYTNPLTISKLKVYAFDPGALGAIQALRNERTATIHRFDRLIASHWQSLRPFHPDN